MTEQERIEKLKMANNGLMKIISGCIRCDTKLRNGQEDITYIPGVKVDCCGITGLLNDTIQNYYTIFKQGEESNVDQEQGSFNYGSFFGIRELAWRIMDFLQKNNSICCQKEKVHDKCGCLVLLGKLEESRDQEAETQDPKKMKKLAFETIKHIVLECSGISKGPNMNKRIIEQARTILALNHQGLTPKTTKALKSVLACWDREKWEVDDL